MSELTRCNYCTLKRIRKRAKELRCRIVLKPSSFMGGTCVFQVPVTKQLPKYIEPNDKLPNGDKVYQKYTVAWFLEIGDHCSC